MKQILMIFDLEVNGHHPGYLRHLLRHWPDADTQLHLVVSPELSARHQDMMQTESCACVAWQPITADELHWYEASKRSLVQRAWVEWRLFCRYAARLHADQGLIMYIDRFQLPLALRLGLPCKTSGIFFRPKFHYAKLTTHRPTQSERRHALREQWLWRSALRHRQLKTLFSLDPLAVAPLQLLSGCTNVVHLPDPVEMYPQPADATGALRRTLGIEQGRKIFLLFGVLDQRKGIYQTLAALRQLSTTQQQQVALLLVGALVEADRAAVKAEIDELTHHSAVQIVAHDEFVSDAQIQLYFELADVILALYQYHIGMSGVLIRAAAAGKPVFASDYGLMGELVCRHQLGMTVDSTQPAEIAKGIAALLAENPGQQLNLKQATLFAKENSGPRFVQTIWEHVAP